MGSEKMVEVPIWLVQDCYRAATHHLARLARLGFKVGDREYDEVLKTMKASDCEGAAPCNCFTCHLYYGDTDEETTD